MQYGRRAYGAHRTMTVQQLAKNIFKSMQANPERDLSFYQVPAGSELEQRVKELLSR